MSKPNGRNRTLGTLICELARRFDQGRTIPIVRTAGLTTGQPAALELVAAARRSLQDILENVPPALPMLFDRVARRAYSSAVK